MKKITYAAKKTGITILGIALLLAGAILLVLPGPGILVIILGLVVLSWEYEWAERHLDRSRRLRQKAVDKAKKKNT